MVEIEVSHGGLCYAMEMVGVGKAGGGGGRCIHEL